ncbi:MAG TPA: ribonuclease P protein component [Luteimonas sp.]|nr:ribonuclease P protein component [Luteimonas sp.]
MDARFPRNARVRTRADYSRIFEGGRRVSHPLLSLHWCDDGQPPRLGLAVSRKVDPNAVGRNRIKRALREQFRALRPLIASGSYVVVARQAAAVAPARDVRAAFVALLQRTGALPPPDADGTMPAAEREPNRSEPIPSSPSMPRPRAG